MEPNGIDIHRPGKIAAFFDLDKTLIHGATMLIAAPLLHERGLISYPTLIRAGIGAKVFEHLGATEARVEKAKKAALDVVAGWDRDEMFALLHDSLDELFREKIYKEAMQLVKQHIALDHLVAVVSSSPVEFVRPIAGMFGIEHVIATEVSIDDQGKCIRAFDQWVSGAAKPDAIRNFAQRNDIDLSSSFGYSDSRTDIGFLEAVGKPVAVNPDKKLAEHAQSKGWEIKHFEAPVQANRPDRNLVQNPWLQVGASAAGVAAISVAGVAINRRYSTQSR